MYTVIPFVNRVTNKDVTLDNTKVSRSVRVVALSRTWVELQFRRIRSTWHARAARLQHVAHASACVCFHHNFPLSHRYGSRKARRS